MSFVDVALIFISLMFGLYAVASSIELGIVLALLKNPKSSVAKLFTPLWEVTNVFLVFGFTATAIVFSSALPKLSHKLLSTLVIAIVALVVRALVVLKIFYLNSQSKKNRQLFALCNLAIPISFAAAGIYMFTGQYFWQSFNGLALLFSAIFGMLSIGMLAVERAEPQEKLVSVELTMSVWLLGLGSIVPFASMLSHIHYQKAPLITLSFLTILGFFAALLKLTTKPNLALWKIAGTIGLVSPILLALANRPYFIAKDTLLSSAYSGGAYVGFFVIGALVTTPLLLIGFRLFWQLMRDN